MSFILLFLSMVNNMPSIQASYNWAVQKCNEPNIGYSQAYREQETRGGITYYDCSSFIWYALLAGGFDVVKANYGDSKAFWTGNMRGVLDRLGFKRYNPNMEWKQGDILWRTGHTEMAFNANKSMGAHTANAILSEQVSINANPPSNKNIWTELYRYEQGATTEWIKGDKYLSTGEQQNNATIIFSYLLDKGWSVNAIAGLLGNMQQESTMCPDLNERGGTGYGLVQWTPKRKYTGWCDLYGYDATDGNIQLMWIDEWSTQQYTINGETFGPQWSKRVEPLEFNDFKTSTLSPEDLATAWEKNFEKPAVPHPERREYARYWFEWFNGEYVPPPNPPQTGDVSFKKGMPIWMYLGRRK